MHKLTVSQSPASEYGSPWSTSLAIRTPMAPHPQIPGMTGVLLRTLAARRNCENLEQALQLRLLRLLLLLVLLLLLFVAVLVGVCCCLLLPLLFVAVCSCSLLFVAVCCSSLLFLAARCDLLLALVAMRHYRNDNHHCNIDNNDAGLFMFPSRRAFCSCLESCLTHISHNYSLRPSTISIDLSHEHHLHCLHLHRPSCPYLAEAHTTEKRMLAEFCGYTVPS